MEQYLHEEQTLEIQRSKTYLRMKSGGNGIEDSTAVVRMEKRKIYIV